MNTPFQHQRGISAYSIVATLLCLCLSLSQTAWAQHAEPEAPFPDGVNAIFIGHSFFIPVARAFDAIASEQGYANHKVTNVAGAGRKGAPGALWRSAKKRAAAERALATGTIDLLAMTAYKHHLSEPEDFQRWISLATQYNPNTAFLIAAPWAPGGPDKGVRAYDLEVERNAVALLGIVRQLRAANPQASIDFIDYGKVASLMKQMWEGGELQDVTRMTDPDSGLFSDRPLGHGGPMLLDMSALVWLNRLYGVSPASLPDLGYDKDAQQEIVAEVARHNTALATE